MFIFIVLCFDREENGRIFPSLRSRQQTLSMFIRSKHDLIVGYVNLNEIAEPYHRLLCNIVYRMDMAD
jgi:hypothetical protein